LKNIVSLIGALLLPLTIAIVVRPKVLSFSKWLWVTALSTPSERVFSYCGLALTAKSSRLKGEALQDQVMIRRNTKCIQVTYNDIQTFYLTNIAGETAKIPSIFNLKIIHFLNPVLSA
jgi:hypothetical protein